MTMTAYVALGANLGKPARQLRRACELLGRLPGTQLLRVSSFYASPALGYTDQPDFINAVASVETRLSAEELLEALLAIEAINGRIRSFRNAPRTLDLDLLLYGDSVIERPGLSVPHPRIIERAFVLNPLLEIAPDIIIPGKGPASGYLAAVSSQPISLFEE
ncbi:2-amino-4-hydroxy-6-hydroxymethyldihydropteridinediphosphokinase [Andreprevotia lacus DSM 23236]|jgi:2-amino-4-hydroxy-6-hydroxymethyldihydropteridine diphosphokinase|uniref:2-amino-4-hydroxy-6-hydroxymethyldihydropteridine pyrophosphokinase n=1 Tax=Andreprevotia lacus DSM 23236 TaxID=1121001 RepID=A0A1W1XYA7_9NEIS|nr:2-amino-4-hydroxy-6-hydroxymethyldihydropteridine diphosphokinase [Andreprevotia lacus]SMC28541.1 2-amino-4-hydroxy-6-hydroxymethyldihydropteridinediphosphokinase [Andreprevotia lacus DSM 23236]